jgi:hypothetical protein
MHARAPCVPAFGARLALAANLRRGTFFDARAILILTMRACGPAQMLTKPNMAISGSVTAPLLYSGRAMYWQFKDCHISCLIPVQPVVGQEMSRAKGEKSPPKMRPKLGSRVRSPQCKQHARSIVSKVSQMHHVDG